MQIFLLLIDYSLPLVMAYLVLQKGSLSIVYVPFFYFMYSMLEKSKIIPIYHLILVLLLVYYAFYNLPFLKYNIFFVILILFFTYNLQVITDFKLFRLRIISLYWIFTIIALAPEICKRYSRDKILKELSISSFLILFFFIINTILSTVLGYYPDNHYGFTSGISFGHIGISEYSILPLAVYLVFRNGIVEKKIIYLLVGFVGLFLVMLTLRRTAMALSLIACVAVFVELLNFKQIRQFAIYLLVIGIGGTIVLKVTGFSDQLMERIEKRNLQDKDLEEEGRFIEFGLVYKDLFVYYDYDPIFGYGPLMSWGNYGKRMFENRPLHSDITYLIHGFGFFGFMLYVFMAYLVFYRAWGRCRNRNDKIIFSFLFFYFIVFFLIGSSK